ncbi:MAG TPA: toll/interleukin-1 receptor domain-containing protein [Allosphingosinicella sp.]|jgi:hypothetical protein
MSHDVFISYSTKDKAVGHAVCARLEERGHRCWIAPRDILPGREWGEAIIDGISGARALVLIFSGNANDSPQVRREVERAVGHGLPIIPFRIEDVAPAKSLEYFISNQHWLDALTPPMERHIEQLADVVTRLLGDRSEGPLLVPQGKETLRRPRLRLRGWWAGLAVSVGALLLVFLWQPFRATRPSPAPPAPPAKVVDPPARAETDPSWLFGRWCVGGDAAIVQVISGGEGRVITDFSGQRQVETVRSAGVGLVTTELARYSRDGSAVVVSEPGYTYRLEACP